MTSPGGCSRPEEGLPWGVQPCRAGACARSPKEGLQFGGQLIRDPQI